MTARSLLVPLALSAALAATPAHAVKFDLGLGGGYWFSNGGGSGTALFGLTLTVRQPFAQRFSVGARLGGLLTTGPVVAGIPIDLVLRVDFRPVYLELLGGPWVLFTDFPLRAHAGVGLGGKIGPIDLGLEVAYLQPAAYLGVRVALRFN